MATEPSTNKCARLSCKLKKKKMFSSKKKMLMTHLSTLMSNVSGMIPKKIHTFSILPSSSFFKDVSRNEVLCKDRNLQCNGKMGCIPRRRLLGSPFPEPKEILKLGFFLSLSKLPSAWLPNFLNCIYWLGQLYNPINPVWPLPSTVNSHDLNLTLQPVLLLQPCPPHVHSALPVCISPRKWSFSEGLLEATGQLPTPGTPACTSELSIPTVHVALNSVASSLSCFLLVTHFLALNSTQPHVQPACLLTLSTCRPAPGLCPPGDSAEGSSNFLQNHNHWGSPSKSHSQTLF